MTFTSLLAYISVFLCIFSAVYVALGTDLYRVTIAFFVELAGVGGVLLSLNADYLALMLFVLGLLGAIIVITFSSIIAGKLKPPKPVNRLAQATGMILGLSLGGAMGWALLTSPLVAKTEVVTGPQLIDMPFLGKLLLSNQVAVFELLSVLVLMAVIGAGIL